MLNMILLFEDQTWTCIVCICRALAEINTVKGNNTEKSGKNN